MNSVNNNRKKELKKALEVAEKHFQVFNKMVKHKQKQKILELLKKSNNIIWSHKQQR